MKRTVRVFVHSAQQYDDYADQITTNSIGEYNNAHHIHTITYAEKIEGNNVVNNVLTLTKEGAQLQRTGAVTSLMSFTLGKTTDSEYINGYGTLNFKVSTMRYDAIIQDDKITVHLLYELHHNGQKVSRNTLQISIDFLPKDYPESQG